MAARRSSKRRYGKAAGRKVKAAMHERKQGKLRSGRSRRKVKSRKQAIAIGLSEARRAGAVIVKPPQPTFYGGYAGYFQDPDRHLWEVAWNPAWP